MNGCDFINVELYIKEKNKDWSCEKKKGRQNKERKRKGRERLSEERRRSHLLVVFLAFYGNWGVVPRAKKKK